MRCGNGKGTGTTHPVRSAARAEARSSLGTVCGCVHRSRRSGACAQRCSAGLRVCGVAGVAGAVLLEVVVSLGLLVFGMAMVGLQVRAGLDTARETNGSTRALMLTDTLLAELDAGAIIPDLTDEEVKGDFGIKAPGYTWRIRVEPADVEHLYMLTLELGFNPGHVEEQMDNPRLEIDFEDEGTTTMRTAYRLYPKPADIDMERDYGLATEDLEKMFGSTSSDSGSAGPEGVESATAAAAGDMASVASEMGGVDLSSLDFLLDPGGFDPRMLSQLPEEEFMQLIDLLEVVLKQGGGAIGGAPGQVGPVGARHVGGDRSGRRSSSEERATAREQRRRDRAQERQDRRDRRGRRGREDGAIENGLDNSAGEGGDVRDRRGVRPDRRDRDEGNEEEGPGSRRRRER